jgi:hypothetical protein
MNTPKLNAAQELALRENTPESEFLDFLRSLEICGDEDLSDANTLLHEMDDKFKKVEEVRKSITEPLNTAKRNVDKLFKPATTALKEAVDCLKKAILDWDNKRYLSPAAESESSVSTVDSTKGLQYRSKWSFTVPYPQLLPEEYVLRIPNIAKIQYEFEKQGVALDIPGVEIVETKTLAVMRSK